MLLLFFPFMWRQACKVSRWGHWPRWPVFRRCQRRRGDQFVPPYQRYRYRRSVHDIDKRPKGIIFVQNDKNATRRLRIISIMTKNVVGKSFLTVPLKGLSYEIDFLRDLAHHRPNTRFYEMCRTYANFFLLDTNITPIQNNKMQAASSFTFSPVQLFSTCNWGDWQK